MADDLLQRDDPDQIIEPVGYDFGFSRRSFMQVLGAGLLICAAGSSGFSQSRPSEEGEGGGRGGNRGGARGGRPVALDARLHIAKDGTITVMSGKVEGGQ